MQVVSNRPQARPLLVVNPGRAQGAFRKRLEGLRQQAGR
jgi:hypothetical protein